MTAIESPVTPPPDMTVLLLPGMHGMADLFDPFVARSPAGFRTRAVQYPRDRHLSVHDLAERVRSDLPVERWLLLGESFSGLVAILLAASRPPGLLGLVLVASAARWSRLRPLKTAPMTAVFSLPTPSALLRWLFLDSNSGELLAATRRAITTTPAAVLAARLRELVTADLRSQLRQVDVPVMYLQASRDRLARRAELRSITSTLSSTEVKVIDGPHFLLQTRPDEAWERIVSFTRSRCVA